MLCQQRGGILEKLTGLGYGPHRYKIKALWITDGKLLRTKVLASQQPFETKLVYEITAGRNLLTNTVDEKRPPARHDSKRYARIAGTGANVDNTCTIWKLQGSDGLDPQQTVDDMQHESLFGRCDACEVCLPIALYDKAEMLHEKHAGSLVNAQSHFLA